MTCSPAHPGSDVSQLVRFIWTRQRIKIVLAEEKPKEAMKTHVGEERLTLKWFIVVKATTDFYILVTFKITMRSLMQYSWLCFKTMRTAT